MSVRASLIAALSALSIAAVAGEEPVIFDASQGWSALSAQSVGQGSHLISTEAGFPGVSVQYLQGLTPSIDVGGRVAFNYGFEGLATALYPGLRAEVVGRLKILDTGRFNLGLRGGVGLFGYFTDQFTLPGVTIPLGLAIGIPVGSAIVVSTGVDVPIFLTLGPLGGLTVPVLFDAGIEYFLDKHWAAQVHSKIGPALNPSGFLMGRPTEIAFEAAAGIELRL